jgi:hypothetical protein
MYDFVRLETKNMAFKNALLDNAILNNKSSLLNIDTGEIAGKVKNQFKGLTFELYPSGRIVIYGSLHKYFNDGIHNYNDFGNKELTDVLNELEINFSKEVLNMTVTGLEFGININTPFTPKIFIDRCISFNSKERNPIIKNDCKGFDKGISFNLIDYRIKIYNKSKQYGRPINILRLENKYLRSRKFEGAGINVLSDLLNQNSNRFLFIDLYKNIDEMIFKEDLDEKRLTRNEERVYLECINTWNWGEWNKAKRIKRKNQYNGIIKKHATSNYKTLILEAMTNKYKSIMYNHKSTNLFQEVLK